MAVTRYVRFEYQGAVSWGVMEDETIRELDGELFPCPGSPGAPDEVPALGFTTRRFPREAVRLLAPVRPSKVFAIIGNYLDHLHHEHVQQAAPPEEPRLFVKVPSSVIGPGDPILLPSGSERVEEEAELVVVIGRRCRDLAPDAAAACVFGYSCGNDVSARDWQKQDRSWWRAKSSDTFSPVGPCVVSGIDGAALEIRARVNGREVQHCNTRDLIHGIPVLVSFLSRHVTLLPGDLIFTGTTGVPARIQDGDTVEVEISSIGTLTNPVRAQT